MKNKLCHDAEVHIHDRRLVVDDDVNHVNVSLCKNSLPIPSMYITGTGPYLLCWYITAKLSIHIQNESH